MKTTVVCAALLCGVVTTSSAALGQQYAPPAARPTATYAGPAARLAQRSPTSYAGARIQQPVSRSAAPATVAAAPAAAVAVSVPSFRPINPPTPAMQRTLVANRTPTPAPPQVRPASNSRATAQPLPPYQPSMNGQGWVAPTASMPYAGGASGYAMGGAPAPVEAAGYDPGLDYSSGGGCCGDGCGHRGGRCCGLHGCLRHGILIPHCSTGDMVQHMPFFGTTHGYYYFRPYHVMHVYSQQELATRWGDDPRNPYDNTMFQRIYEHMGIEARPPVTPPATGVPSAAPEYVVPGPSYIPTPVPSYPSVPQPYGVMPGMMMSPGAPTMPSNTLPLPGIEPIPSPAR